MEEARRPDDQQPQKAGRSLGRPLTVILRTILVFILSQALGYLMVGIGYGLFEPGKHIPIGESITAQFFYILVAEGAAAVLAVMMVRSRGLKLSVIGLGRLPGLRDLYKGALGFGVFYGLLIIAGIFINLFSPDLNNQQQNLGFNNISNGTENLLAFVSLVLLPPIGEETLVRGYLFSGLRGFWRFWPAVLVTSLLFGVAHLELGGGGPLVWAAALDTFLLSIVLCFLRERTGALYAGMLVHMINNLIAFGIHFR